MTLFTRLFKDKSKFKIIIILIIVSIVLICYLIWADAHHIIKQSVIFLLVTGVLVEIIVYVSHHFLERVTIDNSTKKSITK